MPCKLKTRKPSSRWLKIARQRGFTIATGGDDFRPLKEKLLAIGGWSVCVPRIEEDLDAILTRGRRFPGRSRSILGTPSQCHENTALLYEKFPDGKIVTGYALTRDGMWRQHSWLWLDNCVIETTVKRISYFGFILNKAESEMFFRRNTLFVF